MSERQLPGPRSKEILARKQTAVAKPLSALAPVVVRRAKGAFVQDVDDQIFIDLTGGIGCMNVGHSHPKVVQAIAHAAKHFTHTDFTVLPYESFISVCERLCQVTPGQAPKKAALFNSGAEAVENAVKIAKAYTGRPAVLAFDRGFHGRTMMALSLTGRVHPYKDRFGPFASEVYRLPFPYVYRSDDPDLEVHHCLDALEQAFSTTVSADRVAAIVVEPVQGEGGFIPAPLEFLRGLRTCCDKHGILLIIDEIQSGMGRTGTWFACEQYDVEPDLMTVGKSIGAGLPLSAVVGKSEVMDAPVDGSVGGTYIGNPVACAAALAVMDVMEEEHLVDRAKWVGNQIRSFFEARVDATPQIGDVRGIGSMVGVELVKDPKTKEPATAEVHEVLYRVQKRGVIVLKCGVYGNVLRFLAPLNIGRRELMTALNILGEEMDRVFTGR